MSMRAGAIAIVAVLAVAPVRSSDISQSDVIIVNATIASLGDAAWGDPRVPRNMKEGQVPVIVQLDNIDVLVGDYPASHATVVLPIFDAPDVGFRLTVVATKKENIIFQVLDWRSYDWPLCLADKQVRDLQLADAIKRSRFAHWDPECGWAIRQ